ncbi:hypothetical protein FRC06_009440, partial [Ceratobasidium sp. 370]
MIVLWIIRFFVFKLYESPKYLMGGGKFQEAVDVVRAIAKYNSKTSRLTVGQLEAAGMEAADLQNTRNEEGGQKMDTSTQAALIGLAFPLYSAFIPYYLQTRGTVFGGGSVYITYRNQVIISVIGVPGALLGGWVAEIPVLERKGALAIAA